MIIYFLITFFATLIGAVAGMGGGVIIKPVLDMMGNYDIVTISILSSITVLSMALVSTIKQIKNGLMITSPMIVITAGAVIGGTIGGIVFSLVKAQLESNIVTIIQSVILICLMVFCLFYRHLPAIHVHSAIGQGFIGLSLGMLGTFLGIGGGPINVTVLVLILGIGLREAAKLSVFVILFAQAFGLITKAFNGQYAVVQDYSMLLIMIPAAIIGGLIGSILNIKLKEKHIHILFNSAVMIVILICIYNVYSNVII